MEDDPGILAGIWDGLLEIASPRTAYFKQLKAAKDYENSVHAKALAEKRGLLGAMQEKADTPEKKMRLNALGDYLGLANELDFDKIGDVTANSFNDISKSMIPTNTGKDVNYAFNPEIPEPQREMMRQLKLNERPYDNRMLDIKQQNANTQQSAMGIRAQQASQPPKVSLGAGAGGLNLNKDQVINPDGTVSAREGSELYRKQAEEHNKDATKIGSTIDQAGNIISTGRKILASPDFNTQFGKGNLSSGVVAYARRYASPDTMTEIDQFKDQLKTEGGRIYKENANSPGSMQVQEWPILERQLANISPLTSEKEARESIQKAIEFVEKNKSRKQELYTEQYGKTPFFNSGIAGKFALPPDLVKALSVRKNGYKMTKDGDLRQSLYTGDLEINDNGKWVKAKVESQDGENFNLVADTNESNVEKTKDEQSIDDIVKMYNRK
jgi:hypothetical protein